MTVFVGRTSELERLMSRLERAIRGEGGAVFITGEAGAGKSTLTQRFLVDAALRTPEARVISTDCSEQYGAGEPYQPFVDAFRDLLSDEHGGAKRSLRDIGRQLAPYWVQAIPVAGDIIAATMVTAAELKQTLGGATATAAPPSEEALFFQYTELFLAAATEHPMVLFIDDLHWADRASVSLLGHLVRRISDKPALVVGTYRPADVEVSKHPIKQAKLELERYGVAEELALDALDLLSLSEFVVQELGARPTPDLLHLLEQRAGSNPLFFGELLKWLVEQDLAVERDGEWDLSASFEDIEIPRSVESVIEKRLSHLDPDTYRVLEYASVEGDEFDSTVLAQLLDVDELELEERLDPIVRAHKLIRFAETRDLPSGEPTSVYEFNHTLTQDVLHRNLQGKRRILLHRKIADILERTYAPETESIFHKLAFHFDQGRVPERAWNFALEAAGRASRVYAHWDAIDLLKVALRNSRSAAEQMAALERLGDEHRLAGHYQEALRNLNQALDAATAEETPVAALILKRKIASIERDCGSSSPDELRHRLDALAEEARRMQERAELCEILWLLGKITGTGADIALEALSIAEVLDDSHLVARAQFELGGALMGGENPAEAVPHVREALRLGEQAGDKFRMGRCFNCLGIIEVLVGDYDEATRAFAAAAELFDALADPMTEAAVRNNLGQLLLRMGRFQAAEENLLEAIRLARRMDATARLLHHLENMARVQQAVGEAERAEKVWQELLDLSKGMGYWESEIVAHCGLGFLFLDAGDSDRARAEHDAARSLLHDEAWTECREDLDMLAARLAAHDGDVQAAVRILGDAEAELVSRDPYLWATFRLMHAELVFLDNATQAEQMVHECLETFGKLRTQPMMERANQLLARIGG
jgi:tetratricopeptide (TPR) repeat protein